VSGVSYANVNLHLHNKNVKYEVSKYILQRVTAPQAEW